MTSAPVVDERVHVAAIKALLTTPLNGQVFDYSNAPKPPTGPSAILELERRFVPPRTATGLSGRSGWRVSVRFIGMTVNEARWVQFEVTKALDEKRLSIGGFTSTPVTHESTQGIEPDENAFSGWSLYTYAL
jgi:hypothetical protein